MSSNHRIEQMLTGLEIVSYSFNSNIFQEDIAVSDVTVSRIDRFEERPIFEVSAAFDGFSSVVVSEPDVSSEQYCVQRNVVKVGFSLKEGVKTSTGAYHRHIYFTFRTPRYE